MQTDYLKSSTSGKINLYSVASINNNVPEQQQTKTLNTDPTITKPNQTKPNQTKPNQTKPKTKLKCQAARI
jgi:hypothetical protein